MDCVQQQQCTHTPLSGLSTAHQSFHSCPSLLCFVFNCQRHLQTAIGRMTWHMLDAVRVFLLLLGELIHSSSREAP